MGQGSQTKDPDKYAVELSALLLLDKNAILTALLPGGHKQAWIPTLPLLEVVLTGHATQPPASKKKPASQYPHSVLFPDAVIPPPEHLQPEIDD
jgi:hypothetical protein